ncbi:MAG: guanylate kinase [Burkholderiales bacterium]|nr:guanylate kinase [Burkholderiales bacterium]
MRRVSGRLFIVCAPSGAGKTSLVRALLTADPAVHLSVSYTTRPARPGEQDGRDYHFVDAATFGAMRDRGELLESAEVHGNLYGTSQRWIEGEMRAGNDILLEIDWQGAQQVRRLMPDTVGIFILPPSFEILAERLTGRGTDSPAVIARRLQAAQSEIGHAAEFDYTIVNNDFDEASRDLIAIVRAERLRFAAQALRHQDLINRLQQGAAPWPASPSTTH